MIDVYVGRQNIFNATLSTCSYEIKYYTDGEGGNVVGRNTISSALSILQTVIDIGIEKITQGKPAIFNLTGDFIVKQKTLPFQPDIGGILLNANDDEINDTLIRTVSRLGQKKYQVIFDQVRINRYTVSLLHEIHFGRIDWNAYTQPEIQSLIQQLKQYDVHLIIENIPGHEQFEAAKKLGAEYFQGNFFTQPNIIQGKRLPSRRLFVLKMLASLYNPEIDIRDLEIIIKQDVSLGYKLMRMVNSAYYGLNSQIESIQHALVLLGINPLRSWLSVLLLSEIDDQPIPLMSTAIIRGKMCELLGELSQEKDTSSYFVTGLFSILDSMIGMPMTDILDTIPMSDKIYQALLQHEGNLGKTLQSVIAYEQNNWQQINLPKVTIQQIREAYLKSIAWATELANSNLLK